MPFQRQEHVPGSPAPMQTTDSRVKWMIGGPDLRVAGVGLRIQSHPETDGVKFLCRQTVRSGGKTPLLRGEIDMPLIRLQPASIRAPEGQSGKQSIDATEGHPVETTGRECLSDYDRISVPLRLDLQTQLLAAHLRLESQPSEGDTAPEPGPQRVPANRGRRCYRLVRSRFSNQQGIDLFHKELPF